MAVRVDASEVKEILDNCQLDDTEIDPYIVAASALLDQIFANDTVMSTTLLKEVERWYAAHLIACTRFRTKDTEKLGDAAVKYTGKYDIGLDATLYGQTLKQFDVTGKFSSYVGKKQASIYAILSFD